MEHHASYLSTLLTDLLHLARHPWPGFGGGTAYSILERYDHLFAVVLAAVVAILLAAVARRRLAMVPGPWQQVGEFTVNFVRNMVADNIEHHPDRYLPLVGTLGLFILLNNLFGLAPGMPSGTGNWNVTLGCALVVFCYYNFHGMREQGVVKYWAHFAGPIWWLAPLMFPLEILGLGSRILSHSLRLFGNISAEHIVAGIFFGMFPLFLPIPLMVMGLFFGMIQAFVFIMLATIYVSGAVAHEH